MSTFSSTWRRSQALSVAAKEEHERFGHPAIDVEHLFLALLVVGGAGGKVLGSLGVTLRDARAASEQVHSEQVASLGLAPPPTSPAAVIPDPSVGDFLWSDRAKAIMRSIDLEGDDRELLTALLDEPSGHVTRVLRQLGVAEGEVRHAVGAFRPESEEGPSSRGGRAVSYTGFAPAAPSVVWSLVSDPARRLEWDGYFFESLEHRDDGVLVATARQVRPDGRPVKVRPELSTTELVVSRYEPERLIEWEMTWPHKPGERYRRRFSVELRADGTGTRIVLTQTRSTAPGVLARLLGPLVRFSVRQGLFARADAISRAVR